MARLVARRVLMSPHQASSKSDDIVVFEILRDSVCTECGEELSRGRWLRLERDGPHCLACADLSHLVFLPRGDAALTRRAGQYSTLRAIVVRFSGTRKRYERQGILVDEAALARAEQECLADSEARARARERAAERQVGLDAQYRASFTEAIGRLYVGCSESEQAAIAEHACLKYSGRVGRTAAAKRFEPAAIELAVRAHVRHAHTRYDALLVSGWERHEARAAVASEVEQVLESWRSH